MLFLQKLFEQCQPRTTFKHQLTILYFKVSLEYKTSVYRLIKLINIKTSVYNVISKCRSFGNIATITWNITCDEICFHISNVFAHNTCLIKIPMDYSSKGISISMSVVDVT